MTPDDQIAREVAKEAHNAWYCSADFAHFKELLTAIIAKALARSREQGEEDVDAAVRATVTAVEMMHTSCTNKNVTTKYKAAFREIPDAIMSTLRPFLAARHPEERK